MGSKLVPRAKIRLRLDRGTALLKHIGAGNVHCELTDISEGGCQCRIKLEDLSPEAAAAWTAVLSPGRVFVLELSEPVELHGITVPEAEVRWVQVKPQELIFGVSLRGMSEHNSALLNQSLMLVASRKLRGRKEAFAEREGPSSAPPPARKPLSKRRFETTKTNLNS